MPLCKVKFSIFAMHRSLAGNVSERRLRRASIRSASSSAGPLVLGDAHLSLLRSLDAALARQSPGDGVTTADTVPEEPRYLRAVVQTMLSPPAVINTPRSTLEVAAHGELLRKLSEFDDRLVEVLREGDIRLVRAAWVRAQAPSCLLPRRQELEAVGPAGTVPSPLLSCEEAVTLIGGSSRGVGVLSHAWLTAAHPDPEGRRMAIVQRALEEHPHVKALFWE